MRILFAKYRGGIGIRFGSKATLFHCVVFWVILGKELGIYNEESSESRSRSGGTASVDSFVNDYYETGLRFLAADSIKAFLVAFWPTTSGSRDRLEPNSDPNLIITDRNNDEG